MRKKKIIQAKLFFFLKYDLLCQGILYNETQGTAVISWLATSSFVAVTKTNKKRKKPTEYVVTQLFYVIHSDWLNTSNRIQYVSASCRK